MSLIVHDTLSLTTETGVSKIQLCIGDITKLPREEKVDVLVVSAFPGKLVINTDYNMHNSNQQFTKPLTCEIINNNF